MKVTEPERVRGHVGIARRAGAVATLTLAEWEQTILDFNGLCAYCQMRPFTLLEHFLPAITAGTHVKNCIPACDSCNRRKRNYRGEKLVAAFGQETITRIQQYLETRTEQRDVTKPALSDHKHRTITLLVTPKESNQRVNEGRWYISMEGAAQELSVSRSVMYYYVKQLTIEMSKFYQDRKTYILRADLERIKTAKRAASEGKH